MRTQNKLYFGLVLGLFLLLCIGTSRQEDQLPSLERDAKRAHNILRFGRSGYSLYPFRVNRAGHNIMRFGRSDRSFSSGGPQESAPGELLAYDFTPQSAQIQQGDLEGLANELPDLILNGYSYNKKADLRNRNNFIHFG